VLDDVRDTSMLVVEGHDAYVKDTVSTGSWARLSAEEAAFDLAQSAAFVDVLADPVGTGWVPVATFETVANPVFDRYVAWVSEAFPYDPSVDPIEPLDRRVLLRNVSLIRDYVARVRSKQPPR